MAGNRNLDWKYEYFQFLLLVHCLRFLHRFCFPVWLFYLDAFLPGGPWPPFIFKDEALMSWLEVLYTWMGFILRWLGRQWGFTPGASKCQYMSVFFLKWVSCCRKESVVLRLGGQRGGEKNSLSVKTVTRLQLPSVPNVTSTESLWFSFYGK